MGLRLGHVSNNQFLCGLPVPYDAAIHAGGPVFTRLQYAELLHRVKKIRVQASCSYSYAITYLGTDDPPPTGFPFPTQTGTIDLDVTMERVTHVGEGSTALTEIQVFEEGISRIEPYATLTNLSGDGMASMYPTTPWIDGSNIKPSKLFFDAHKSVDGTVGGIYWLANFEFGSNPSGYGGDATFTDITVTLAGMNSGNVSIPMKYTSSLVSEIIDYKRDEVTISGVSIALTVVEWFPYATKAGDPAWNTTTGAPANGGPGA